MALVAQWLLSAIDGSGNTPDASGNGWTGAVKPTYPGNCPSIGAGPFSALPNAMVFDGSDDYVDVGLVHTVGDVFSICAWVRPSSLTRLSIYSAGNSAGCPTFSGSYLNNGGLEIASPGLFHDVSVGGILTAGRWAHVAYCRAGKLPRSGRVFYVNGAPVAMATQGDYDLGNNVASTKLGCRAASLQSWSTGLADVRLYSNALTAAEVYDIYKISLRENSALLGLMP